MQIVQASVEPITPIDGKAIMSFIEDCARTCYKSSAKKTEDSAERLVKSLLNSGHTSVFEHFNITMRYVSNIACYKDLTRHRAGTAYSIESTRYCNYNNGKFGGELKVLDPIEIQRGTPEWYTWVSAMIQAESHYKTMAQAGCTPDQMSLVLPQSTAAEFVMTANLRSWLHILALRSSVAQTGHARPCVKQIMDNTLFRFAHELPAIFGEMAQVAKNKGR